MLAAFGTAPTSLLFNMPNASDVAVGKPTFSDFYCASCASGTRIVNWQGATANANQSSITTFEANSQYGDPNISTSGSPPSLNITSCSGAACDKGTAAENLDYLGTTRP